MAYKIINKEYCIYTDADKYSFVADSLADINTLPSCSAGSDCICSGDGGIYIMGADGNWHKM